MYGDGDELEDLKQKCEALDNMLQQYMAKFTTLQVQQKQMRDPERKMVCDILANGKTDEQGVK